MDERKERESSERVLLERNIDIEDRRERGRLEREREREDRREKETEDIRERERERERERVAKLHIEKCALRVCQNSNCLVM
jgi:hypothetical protein